MAELRRSPGFVRLVEVMGTVFSVCVRDSDLDPEAIDDVIGWWQHVDATFSPFRPDSHVSRLNRGELGAADLAEQMNEVISLCRLAEEATVGYFDAWQSGAFDPCGVVKGWSIELASAMLAAAGSANHCINGGGDIRCMGEPEPGRLWRVGVANPMRPRGLAATIEVGDGAVATSGRAERGDQVVDPHSGVPVRSLASVTVVGPDLTWADAYATAAFAMGPDACAWLRQLEGHQGLVVSADGRVKPTPGLIEARRPQTRTRSLT
jgi:thiamine biosynthesis lipoprotein